MRHNRDLRHRVQEIDAVKGIAAAAATATAAAVVVNGA